MKFVKKVFESCVVMCSDVVASFIDNEPQPDAKEYFLDELAGVENKSADNKFI